jgi:uncharacterized protein
VYEHGLVPINQLANRFVNDPNTVVQVKQQVKATVSEVDIPHKRNALSMKTASKEKI